MKKIFLGLLTLTILSVVYFYSQDTHSTRAPELVLQNNHAIEYAETVSSIDNYAEYVISIESHVDELFDLVGDPASDPLPNIEATIQVVKNSIAPIAHPGSCTLIANYELPDKTYGQVAVTPFYASEERYKKEDLDSLYKKVGILVRKNDVTGLGTSDQILTIGNTGWTCTQSTVLDVIEFKLRLLTGEEKESVITDFRVVYHE